jgi:hypothetical protein
MRASEGHVKDEMQADIDVLGASEIVVVLSKSERGMIVAIESNHFCD